MGQLPYPEGRRVMLKVKHQRSADCVVSWFRRRAGDDGMGSLLLGLYDQQGLLRHVGITSSFTAQRRLELLAELEPHRADQPEQHPWLGAVEGDSAGGQPGSPSRWTAERDLSFEPLRPELVCEVAYDHLQGDRFRHATTFLRWRGGPRSPHLHLPAAGGGGADRAVRDLRRPATAAGLP